jgi:4-hydroxy-2-oxoheptanedioate aldolase
VKDYLAQANDETMVILMIEDIEGVDNVESILKTDGVDCVFIGRGDLSLSMGCVGRKDDPALKAAIEKVVQATLDAGVGLMVATDEREGPLWIERGARFFSIQVVSFLRRKWTECLTELQDHMRR